jgi:hypothetical protein
LAIALVVASNMAFAQLKKPEEITLIGEQKDESHSDHLHEEPNISKIKESIEDVREVTAEPIEKIHDQGEDLYGESDTSVNDARFTAHVNNLDMDSATIQKIKKSLEIWKGKKK